MKLCRFNYFLKENEKIVFYTKCRLRSITAFDIIDTEGMLLASDRRLIFCKIIGEHPHILQSYDYKYISSCDIKENDDTYLYIKYNGDPIKILGLNKSTYEDIIKIVSLGDKASYNDLLNTIHK